MMEVQASLTLRGIKYQNESQEEIRMTLYSYPGTRTTPDGTVQYELGDDWVTKAEFDEYSAAEDENESIQPYTE